MTNQEKATKPDKKVVLEYVMAERRELLELCRSLTPAEWDHQTLCEDWKVRDIVAHIAIVPKDALTYFTASPDKANQKIVDKRRNLAPQELIRSLENVSQQPNFIVKVMPAGTLWDNWVHQQDIRWVLGPERQRSLDNDRIRIILETFRKKISKDKRGLRYEATDMDWSAGEGQLVKGPAEALIMALSKRPRALERLEGPGVDTLRQSFKDKH